MTSNRNSSDVFPYSLDHIQAALNSKEMTLLQRVFRLARSESVGQSVYGYVGSLGDGWELLSWDLRDTIDWMLLQGLLEVGVLAWEPIAGTDGEQILVTHLETTAAGVHFEHILSGWEGRWPE